MDIDVRLARSTEIDEIIQLQRLAIACVPDRYRRYKHYQVNSLIRGQEKAARLDCQFTTVVVAETEGGRLVGYAALLTYAPEIVGIFVHPNFMGCGIGTQLLAELERLAIARQFHTLWAMGSIEAIDFYLQNGYRSHRPDGFISDGWVWIPCQKFSKQLRPIPHAESIVVALKAIASIVFIAWLAMRLLNR